MERGPDDRFSDTQVSEALQTLEGWVRNGDRIEKRFVRKAFMDAVQFIERIATEAERLDHHPDILLHGYKNVTVMLSTHSAGGITQNDIDLARRIETVA